MSLISAWFINELTPKVRALLTLVFYAPSISGNAYLIWSVAFSGDDYGYIHIDNTGYCVYGNVDDCVTVYELVGDREALLNKLFCDCGAYAVRLRGSVSQGGTPCGMYKAFGDVPRIEAAFMGAYGG
jgi:hypothetical protein